MIEEYNQGKHYLYRHIRLDTNQPFYIGIGTIGDKDKKYGYYTRAYIKNNRNKWWKNIVGKTSYKVEILLESNNKTFILEKEKEFIKLYGRKQLGLGELVNLTDGGDGTLGNIVKNKKKVYQFTENGEFIKEWESISSVSDYFQKDRPLLTRTLRYNSQGRCRKIKNYIFQYEKDFIQKDRNYLKKPYRNKKIALYLEDGTFIKQWDSVTECAKELNSYVSTISDLCKGKIIDGKTIKKNYRFKYI